MSCGKVYVINPDYISQLCDTVKATSAKTMKRINSYWNIAMVFMVTDDMYTHCI